MRVKQKAASSTNLQGRHAERASAPKHLACSAEFAGGCAQDPSRLKALRMTPLFH
jgi:hypothetical protein